MEQLTNNIRKELDHCLVTWEYAKYCDDAKGMRFILGYHAGLERALAMLNGDEPIVDDEVEAWWNGREAEKRAGTLHVTPWAIDVWLGRGETAALCLHLFSLRGRRAATYVNVLTNVVAFLSRHGIQVRLTEGRD